MRGPVPVVAAADSNDQQCKERERAAALAADDGRLSCGNRSWLSVLGGHLTPGSRNPNGRRKVAEFGRDVPLEARRLLNLSPSGAPIRALGPYLTVGCLVRS